MFAVDFDKKNNKKILALEIGIVCSVHCVHLTVREGELEIRYNTSCGAGHNKPRPLLPPSECNWLWAMAGDNKLTFDPPTCLVQFLYAERRASKYQLIACQDDGCC